MPPTKLYPGNVQGVHVPLHVEVAVQQMVSDGRRVADIVRVALTEYVARQEAEQARKECERQPISDEEILQRR